MGWVRLHSSLLYNLSYLLLRRLSAYSNSALQGEKAQLNHSWVVSPDAGGKQHLLFADLHSKNYPLFPEKKGARLP